MAVYSAIKDDIFSSIIVFQLIYFCSSKSKKYFFRPTICNIERNKFPVMILRFFKYFFDLSRPVFTCSNSAMETLE